MSLDEIKAQILAITPTKEYLLTQEFKDKNRAIKESISNCKSGQSELYIWLSDKKFSDNCFVMKLIGNFFDKDWLGPDDQKEITHFKKAYELGYPCLAYGIGMVYLCGETMEKNYAKAMKWFLRSIENKYLYKYSFLQIGKMYSLGLGVPRDYAKSNYYLGMGVEDPSAMNMLGTYYIDGDPDGKLINYDLAKKFLLKGVELKSYEACWNLGLLYCEKILPRTEDNCRTGFEWYKKAIENNDPNWFEELGLKYMNNDFVITDYAEGLRLLLISAEKNIDRADNYRCLFAIGFFYHTKKKDENEAMIWYQRASEKGSTGALWNLGLICVSQGKKLEAVNYYLEAYKKYPEVEDKMLCENAIIKLLKGNDMSVIYEFVSFWKENKILVEENERLSMELSFRPEGSGYIAAKEHFEKSAKN
ncbi:MAG: tetratricopeptide repeat protein [Harvfovirus sp.]|uniref:Tetratricopeptide repeat protein n=1 Tax=Harvfovirus sp. TaxID=2487768 RepID=A0A3G5A2C0_9VIRU|nr:MAG: tetratricopeptide repeat protein [Harvfovirus sp.]